VLDIFGDGNWLDGGLHLRFEGIGNLGRVDDGADVGGHHLDQIPNHGFVS